MRLSLRAFIILALASVTFSAHAAPPASGSTEQHPPRIGLVDMGYVFKNYEKFKTLTAALQQDAEQHEANIQAQMEKLQQMRKQMAEQAPNEGSPEYLELERRLVQAQTEFETTRKVTEREFVRKEADIYKTVYLEVADVTRRFGEHYNFVLILRFNRQPVAEAENPRDVLSSMNQQVVFHRPQDDLTDSVLTHLNKEWQRQQTAGAPNANPTR